MGRECHAQVKKTVWRWRLTRMYIDMAVCARVTPADAAEVGPPPVAENEKKNCF